MPILTAMVSIYKSSQWLRRRFLNLMNTATWQRGELLIYAVNAESPDENDDRIASEFVGLSNFKYEKIPYCTVYGAWNWIIRRTNTEFLANANTDDIVAPDCYDLLIDVCRTRNASLSYCGWYAIKDPIDWAQINNDAFINYPGSYDPGRDLISCGHFPLWRRSLHDVVGLFDPSMQALGDADFWMRCWQNNIRDFVDIQLPKAAYLWRDGHNLWFKTPEERRAEEWAILRSRGPGKLEFQ